MVANDTDSEIYQSPEIQIVMKLAEEAGEVLRKYHKTALTVDYKQDRFDPVSTADREADTLLREGIAAAFPSDEILSEENPLLPSSYKNRVWMIDSLDDSKGYLAGRDTAGIMIGLLEKNKPKIGVVYLPFRNEWLYGEAGKGSYRIREGVAHRLHVSGVTSIKDAALVGRHTVTGDIRPIDDAIAKLKFKNTVPEGCIGAKIGLIADSQADAFIHTNLKAGKWDTLASQVILSEAGGVMSDIDGNPLDYTKPDSGWKRYFVAACTPTLLTAIVSQLAEINSQLSVF